MTAEHDWEQLNADYRENGIALALGAGVSLDCSVPNWRDLLERIAIRCYGDEGEKRFQEMLGDGYPLPAIAGILEQDCPKGCDFTEVIREALYQSFPYYENGLTKFNSEKFVDFVKAKNRTLSAVAALCAVKQSPESYAANRRIHAIVNSNFDAILREYARARYRAKTVHGILRTVERPSAGAIPGRINVYHVHGFFQFRKDKRTPDEEAPDIRVFTEQEYFDFFNQPNSFFSYTFLYSLREYSLLFIGMSLKDENIRRLLHYSRKEMRESYEKEKEPPDEAERKSIRHYAIQKYTGSDSLSKMTETSLLRLGVRVLWINDFGEIPTRLGKMYESMPGVRWSDVYSL
jgi:SIR2-like domain